MVEGNGRLRSCPIPLLKKHLQGIVGLMLSDNVILSGSEESLSQLIGFT